MPEIELIGDDHVYHQRDDVYVDTGATAKARLVDGNYMDLAVTIVTTTVPSPCDTVGKYVVEYEAVSLYGIKSRMQRIVEVGQSTCIVDICLLCDVSILKLS